MNAVSVAVRSFNQLFEGAAAVSIPDYQRPYTWSQEMAAALLEDLIIALTDTSPASDYYLGSVIFYQNAAGDTYEIVDGQQRVTTLLIIKYLLDEALPAHLNQQ